MKLLFVTVFILAAVLNFSNVYALESRCEQFDINGETACTVIRDIIDIPHNLMRQDVFLNLPLTISFIVTKFHTNVETQLANFDSRVGENDPFFDVNGVGAMESNAWVAGLFDATYLMHDGVRVYLNSKIQLKFDGSEAGANPIAINVAWMLDPNRNPDLPAAANLAKDHQNFCTDVIARCPNKFGEIEMQLATCVDFMKERRPIDFDGIFTRKGDSVMCRKLFFYNVFSYDGDVCALVDVTNNNHICADS